MVTTKYLGWWVDSSASVHVCTDRAQFKIYEEADDKKVLMCNHSMVKVLGQGMVEFQFTSGKKLTLKNVLYVPKIRKNLVSAFFFYYVGMVLKLLWDLITFYFLRM